jgi:hypothetical protein
MKKKLLFVTYFDEHPDAGLSYVISLAKAMNEDLTICLLREKRFSERMDGILSAATFAEAGELDTARQMAAGDTQDADENTEKKLAVLFYRCKKSGIKVDLYSSRADVISAVEKYFKERNGIDIILLGPNVTVNGNLSGRKLKKLSHAVARPIVTIGSQEAAAAI